MTATTTFEVQCDFLNYPQITPKRIHDCLRGLRTSLKHSVLTQVSQDGRSIMVLCPDPAEAQLIRATLEQQFICKLRLVGGNDEQNTDEV
jgi:hypothetical protein